LIAAQAQEWFVLHRAGELTAAQHQQFVDWLCESPAHTHEYLALAGFIQDLQQVATQIATPAEVLIARARAELDVVQPILDEIGEEHRGRSFAIIIDEAHSSQGGKTLSEALADPEDTVNDALEKRMAAHLRIMRQVVAAIEIPLAEHTGHALNGGDRDRYRNRVAAGASIVKKVSGALSDGS
jgi:Domain of unknown function (DUF4880)